MMFALHLYLHCVWCYFLMDETFNFWAFALHYHSSKRPSLRCDRNDYSPLFFESSPSSFSASKALPSSVSDTMTVPALAVLR